MSTGNEGRITADDIAKIETLVGYLQPLYDELYKKSGWHFLPAVIEEAEDWIDELYDRANITVKSELAMNKDTNREG